MRTALLASLLFALSAAAAGAGGIAAPVVETQPPQAVSVPVQPRADWGGFYVGARWVTHSTATTGSVTGSSSAAPQSVRW